MHGETGIGADGTLILNESLFNGTEDLVKLDLSYCGVTSIYVLKLSTDSSMICGILELNLSGNPIMQEYRYPRKLILLNMVQQLGLNLVIVQMMKLELKLLHLASMTAAKCRGIVFCMVKIKIWFSSEAYQGPDNPFVLRGNEMLCETLLQKGLIFLLCCYNIVIQGKSQTVLPKQQDLVCVLLSLFFLVIFCSTHNLSDNILMMQAKA
ncbi:PREDICTED: uncharacterized protein LOC103330894 isoform X2 [Prunus mume]|uniref:Uncharacterized protein LOC103330894 isoform X2 n=1 Tax=Prunus mume TaxID=102107 RepID=A0ABM1LX90_PRUMU|nr:PREDICTED: uncharacterized protein LOC103330894 isoform X2 [Prunus mume]